VIDGKEGQHDGNEIGVYYLFDGGLEINKSSN